MVGDVIFPYNEYVAGVLGVYPARKDFKAVLFQNPTSKVSKQVEKVYSDFDKEMKAVEAAVRPMPMKVR